MCGIFAAYQVPDVQAFKPKALEYSKRIRHRGPDWSGNRVANSTILCHERLAIVGLESGAQPITSSDGRYILTVNGEIYNHIKLRSQLKDYDFQTLSDCEVIIPLVEKYGLDAPQYLDGLFAWVLYDTKKDRVVAARDPIGITTLYMGRSSKNPKSLFFASELKSLVDECDNIIAFPPGNVYDSDTDKLTRYFKPDWFDEKRIPHEVVDYKAIRETFERAVRKRLMAEVPFGVLLSGGLDSSLVASIATREIAKAAHDEDDEQPEELTGMDDAGHLRLTSGWSRLHSYAIGIPGAPDLGAARKVAKFIGTIHHEHHFTLQEGFDSLKDVIYHLETYDVTTFVPPCRCIFYLERSRHKVLRWFYQVKDLMRSSVVICTLPVLQMLKNSIPNVLKESRTCILPIVYVPTNLHAWGLEARVPFLDKEFLQLCMNIDPKYKLIDQKAGKIEKYILRKAFDTTDEPDVKPYLPKEILWRQKEQFSDGVGYSWIDGLKELAEKQVSDEEFAHPKPEWGSDIPHTKEAFFYRVLFDQLFPSKAAAATVVRWIPNGDWGCAEDPSGRYAKIHEAYVDE